MSITHTYADICQAIYLISQALLMTFGIKCADPSDICPKQLPRTQRVRVWRAHIQMCIYFKNSNGTAVAKGCAVAHSGVGLMRAHQSLQPPMSARIQVVCL